MNNLVVVNTFSLDQHDLLLSLRDIAAPLVGDPVVADAIARRAIAKLRRRNLRHKIDKVRGLAAQEWLEQEVLSLCLEATDCSQCAEEENPEREPGDPKDGGESSDDEDEEELESDVG